MRSSTSHNSPLFDRPRGNKNLMHARRRLRRAVSFDGGFPWDWQSDISRHQEQSQQPKIQGILKKETSAYDKEGSSLGSARRNPRKIVKVLPNTQKLAKVLSGTLGVGSLTPEEKKKVSFGAKSVVEEVSRGPICDSATTMLWYTREEIQELKSVNAALVASKLKGQLEENESNTFMGLEPLLRKDKIKEKRESIMDAVMHEQARQMSKNLPVDAARVARACRRQRRSFSAPRPRPTASLSATGPQRGSATISARGA